MIFVYTLAPQKKSGQFTHVGLDARVGAVDQEHTEGVFSEDARQLISDDVFKQIW